MKLGIISEIERDQEKLNYVAVETYENEDVKTIYPDIKSEQFFSLGELVKINNNALSKVNEENLSIEEISSLSYLLYAKKEKLKKYVDLYENYYSKYKETNKETDKNAFIKVKKLIKIELLIIDRLVQAYENSIENINKKDETFETEDIKLKISNFIRYAIFNKVDVNTWLYYYFLYEKYKDKLDSKLLIYLADTLLNAGIYGCETAKQCEAYGYAYSNLRSDYLKLNNNNLKL